MKHLTLYEASWSGFTIIYACILPVVISNYLEFIYNYNIIQIIVILTYMHVCQQISLLTHIY